MISGLEVGLSALAGGGAQHVPNVLPRLFQQVPQSFIAAIYIYLSLSLAQFDWSVHAAQPSVHASIRSVELKPLQRSQRGSHRTGFRVLEERRGECALPTKGIGVVEYSILSLFSLFSLSPSLQYPLQIPQIIYFSQSIQSICVSQFAAAAVHYREICPQSTPAVLGVLERR